MYSKISKILFLALVVSILSYLFYYNSHAVTLKLGESYNKSMPLALLLVVSFFLGLFSLGLSLLFLGMKMKYSLWRSNKDIAEKEKHFKELLQAKDLLALGNLKESASLLKKIIARDPHNVLARVFLSEVSLAENSEDEAISILEKTRAEEKNSPALLTQLACIYEKKGNLTAAYDNVMLALKDSPKSIPLLNKGIKITRSLGKFQDAKNYANTLLKTCPYGEQESVQNLIAEIQLEEAKLISNSNPSEYKDVLLKLVKDHKNYPPLHLELANLQIKSGEKEQAIKTLKKLLTNTHSVNALEKLVNFWLESKNPSEAIAILKATAENNIKELKLPAEILLIQVLIHLEATDEARELMVKLKENVKNKPQFESFIIALQAKLESKTPGRSSTNLALEKLIIKEATNMNLPSIPPKILHPNLTKDQLEVLGYEFEVHRAHNK